MVIALGSPARSVPRRLLEHRGVRFIGKISYGIYVYHDFILPLLITYVLHAGLAKFIKSPLIVPAFAIAGSVISIAIAYVSWHAFEKHALKLKRFFPYART